MIRGTLLTPPERQQLLAVLLLDLREGLVNGQPSKTRGTALTSAGREYGGRRPLLGNADQLRFVTHRTLPHLNFLPYHIIHYDYHAIKRL